MPLQRLLLLLLSLTLSACDPPRKNFSIKINGTTTAYKDNDVTITNGVPFESGFENPIVSGTVMIGNHLEEANHHGPGYCCRRVLLVNSGNSGNLMSSLYLHLGAFSGRGPNTVIHDFWASSISLPADHSPIDLAIQVGNDLFLHSSVRLKDDVMVIPVYAHVFTGGNSQSQVFSEKQLAACFDLPNFTTFGTSVNNPNEPEVSVTTYHFPNYAPPDTIWRQARIQFRLMSVEYVEHPAFNTQIISDNPQSTLVSGFHATHNLNIPGFHIYFGGDARQLESEGQAIGYSPICNVNTTANSSNHIALEFGASPYALSHELGHMLGLGHVDGIGSANACRAGLLGNAPVEGNLMKERDYGYKLSQGQIAHARLVACKYLQLWNMPNDACANP